MEVLDISRAKRIDGWMSDSELEWLARQAATHLCILEIGSYKGRSTRALGDNTPGKVYALDPWESVYYHDDERPFMGDFNVYDEFYRNLEDLIKIHKVLPIRNHSTNYATNQTFDFIFIDGDHRYKTVLSDIDLAKNVIQKGGIIAGHDYTHWDWPSVKRAVDEEFGNRVQTVAESIWYVEV